jgi:tetratricopeptide (TPR) repeat protein
MAEYSGHRNLMREQAFLLCSLNKDTWEPWEYRRAVNFLNTAVEAMVKFFPDVETLAVAQKACELAQHAEDKYAEGKAFYLHAMMRFRMKEFQTARNLAKISLGIRQLIRDKHKEGGVLNLLAAIDHAETNYLEARCQATEALRIEREFNCRHGEGRSRFLLGKIDHDEDNYSEALRHTILALKAYQGVGDLWHVADALRLLSDIAGHLNKPRTAFDLKALSEVIDTENKLIDRQDKLVKCADLFPLPSDKEKAQIRFEQILADYQKEGGEKIIKRMLENLRKKDDEQCDHSH